MQLRKVVENFQRRPQGECHEMLGAAQVSATTGPHSLSTASWHQTAAKRICIH